MVYVRVGTLACLLGVCLFGLGCANAFVRPDEIRGGGDSDQEVLTLSGPGTIESNADGWEATTKKDGKITCITPSETKAERDVKVV